MSFRSSALLFLAFQVSSAFRIDRHTCGKAYRALKKTCGTKGDECATCVHDGISKLQEACSEKASHIAPRMICKQRDGNGEGDPKDNDRRSCGKMIWALRKTCGKTDGDCGTCVQNSMSKLEEACGQRASQVAPRICKQRGGHDDGDDDKHGDDDDRRSCGITLWTLRKTCGKKGDECDTCIQGSMSKLEEACGKKASYYAARSCKAGDRDADEKVDDGAGPALVRASNQIACYPSSYDFLLKRNAAYRTCCLDGESFYKDGRYRDISYYEGSCCGSCAQGMRHRGFPWEGENMCIDLGEDCGC